MPDGRSIAYFRYLGAAAGDERWAVVVADADGRKPRRVGVTSTWDWLDWAPDSKAILWTDYDKIFVARADGRASPRLIAMGEAPDWG